MVSKICMSSPLWCHVCNVFHTSRSNCSVSCFLVVQWHLVCHGQKRSWGAVSAGQRGSPVHRRWEWTNECNCKGQSQTLQVSCLQSSSCSLRNTKLTGALILPATAVLSVLPGLNVFSFSLAAVTGMSVLTWLALSPTQRILPSSRWSTGVLPLFFKKEVSTWLLKMQNYLGD